MVSCAIIACSYFRSWAGLLSLSVNVCDVSSEMSADEELLLISAAASTATISLVAISCNLTLTLSLAATLLPDEYFPTRLKACDYCMQELQRVACNNCT